MKKYLSFLVCSLLTIPGFAQNPAVLLRDTTRLHISLSELEKKYPPALAKNVNERAVFTQGAKRFLDTVSARNRQFYAFLEQNRKRFPVQGIMLQTQEFIRPDGTYAQVFCQFLGVNLTPDQENRFLQILNEWYVSNPFPFKNETGFRWKNMAALGSSHEKTVRRRAAGAIYALEEARQTARPDTVKILTFSQLDLRTIPDIIYRFPNLEELDLSRNLISELPARVTADLPRLKKLSLLYNVLVDDSVFITRNRHVSSLNLQGNRLTHVPLSIRKNRRLESLWLGNNKLKELDTKPLRSFHRLTDLNLYNASLTQLPKTIGKLKHVKVLDLYYNTFAELPLQIGRMKRLEQLAISFTGLKALPASIAKLRHLQVLYAHHNRISQLPDEFSKLRSLRILDLGDNWFSTAPNVLGSLSSVEEISLNNNNLQNFPSVLFSMPSLKKVNIGSNPAFGNEAMRSPYTQQIRQLETNSIQVSY